MTVYFVMMVIWSPAPTVLPHRTAAVDRLLAESTVTLTGIGQPPAELSVGVGPCSWRLAYAHLVSCWPSVLKKRPLSC